jgi:hypothetical protein
MRQEARAKHFIVKAGENLFFAVNRHGRSPRGGGSYSEPGSSIDTTSGMVIATHQFTNLSNLKVDCRTRMSALSPNYRLRPSDNIQLS